MKNFSREGENFFLIVSVGYKIGKEFYSKYERDKAKIPTERETADQSFLGSNI